MTRDLDKTDAVFVKPVVVADPFEGSPIPFACPIKAGDLGTFGSYRIIKMVGRGAAGAVYQAVEAKLGRECALKILIPRVAGKRIRERFIREARACSKIKSDHVVA